MIGGRYELESLLGEGGMGAVWRARHLITKKHVALKLLKQSGAANDKVLKRFLREARAVSAVQHPNVVQVHDVIQLDDGAPVMVMDLLEGEDLAHKLARVGRLELDELSRLLLPVVSAVGCAHAAGIVHRDLKPDNIMLHLQADGSVVPKVLDFGIAKLSATEGDAASTTNLTQTGAVMGTAYYMPPEQVFGEKDVDQRADVWAMGVIMYECLAGRKPIEGENFGQIFKAIAMGNIQPLQELAPWLPGDVCELVGRMLISDRAERCADLREAYEVLGRHTEAEARSFGAYAAAPESAAAQSVDGITKDTASAATQKPGSRAALAAAAIVLVTGLGGGLWYATRSGTPPATPAAAPSPQIQEELPEAASVALDTREPEVAPVESAGVPAPSVFEAAGPVEAPSSHVRPPAPATKPRVLAAKPAAPPSAAPEAPKPKPTSTQITGGVVGEAPF
ncbi:MAG: serine/threonine-protein kinase [Polyangiaceae bacterium]